MMSYKGFTKDMAINKNDGRATFMLSIPPRGHLALFLIDLLTWNFLQVTIWNK